MELYAAIDLHSNNSVLCVLDETDRIVFSKRLPNDLVKIKQALRGCPGVVRGVAVESTYNWYWLVDGLQDAGFTLHLVNTCAVKQYDGLKHSSDADDARHLAHLLRLGILPTGHIYPREQRALRDLLRKRSQLVRQRTSQVLSMQNLTARNLGAHASGNEIKRWTDDDIAAMPMLPQQRLALMTNRAVMACLDEQVRRLESAILGQARSFDPLCEDFQALLSVPGIGKTLALTIALEAGDMNRFASPGNFASYARAVDSRRESNGKKKGEGNAKCGNKHLAWAFIEAAHFAVRYDETIRRWF
ncbi:IS110 family transposase, partial [Roseateles sp. DXS20W]